MPDLSFALLHVADPAASARFYEAALGRAPVERSATFAMIPAASGVMLGLWKRDGVVPPARAGGGTELAMTLADDAAVDALHAEWAARGVAMALPPTRLDFGYGFVARDPDGHWLRVFAPSAP